MRPLPYVWPYAPFFFWAYLPEWKIVNNARREQGEADSKSLQVILLGQGLAFFACFPMAWIPALRFTTHPLIVFYAGLATLIAGALLRRHCFRMLGASVRHQTYSAGILLNAGVAIALGTWAGAILLAFASAAVYVYRMNVEERTLLNVVGDPYRQFMSGRKRLIPFIY